MTDAGKFYTAYAIILITIAAGLLHSPWWYILSAISSVIYVSDFIMSKDTLIDEDEVYFLIAPIKIIHTPNWVIEEGRKAMTAMKTENAKKTINWFAGINIFEI